MSGQTLLVDAELPQCCLRARVLISQPGSRQDIQPMLSAKAFIHAIESQWLPLIETKNAHGTQVTDDEVVIGDG